MLFLQILITAIFSGLYQLTSHLIVLMYAPKLDLIPRYIIGTLGLLLPPSVFLALTGHADSLFVMWACAVSSGLAVIGARAIGAKINHLRDQLDELQRLRALHGETQKED